MKFENIWQYFYDIQLLYVSISHLLLISHFFLSLLWSTPPFGCFPIFILLEYRSALLSYRKENDLFYFILCFHHIQVNKVFQDDDPMIALEDVIDNNLEASYPMEDVYKVRFCLDTSMTDDSMLLCSLLSPAFFLWGQD